ncbi:hypothetical protein MFIFM68171_10133 [Madurella fahalii]|uniref:Protein kinase domain-containing protein n=1 Tax=Madurella fahalii TaxID=1157608 RepID=A0ABQ0GQD0_9PEZI
MQRRACETPVASEDDIRSFELMAVEGPVKDIICALCMDIGTDPEFGGFNTSRISFANHSLSITSQTVDEAISTGMAESTGKQRRQPSPTKRIAVEPKEIRPDRRCIREDPAGNRAIAFVVEYKGAHMLRVNRLHQSLEEDLFTKVVIKQRASTRISTETDQASRDASDLLTAMVLTQTFDYMIRLGLEYGYLTAGKSFLFLRVKEHEPSTLYYALVDPGEEAEAEDGELREFSTAVAQVASFSLLALRSETRSRHWVDEARKVLLPDMARGRRDDDGSSDDGDERNYHVSQNLHDAGSVSLSLQTKRKDAPSSSSSGNPSSDEAERQTWQYCTQACLLGLKRGYELDKDCPNVSSHRTVAGGSLHPIGISDLCQLMREQLARCLDRDCEPLERRGKYGARGTLFKLSLAPYGYTFVGKGTIREYARYLSQEARVYGRLENLQGNAVPVFLGDVSLVNPYYLTARDALRFAGTSIVYMLLMSWAGEEATEATVPDLAAEVARSLQALWSEGVIHGDERPANLLWSEERRRVMAVDFDRASLIPPGKHRQVERLSGKKKRLGGNLDDNRRKRTLHGR